MKEMMEIFGELGKLLEFEKNPLKFDRKFMRFREDQQQHQQCHQQK